MSGRSAIEGSRRVRAVTTDGSEPETWRLLHEGQVVAALIVTGGDMPWVNARVEHRPGFAGVKPLFEEEFRLLDLIDTGGIAEWEAVQSAICSQARLTDAEGAEVPEYLLHIQGSCAWWRWHDTPFEATEGERGRSRRRPCARHLRRRLLRRYRHARPAVSKVSLMR